MELLKKVFINGKIELLTGLHIGGSSTAFDIGGIDSNVIKDANGIPYIPGSSMKGKMRSLLEMKYSKYTQKTGNPDDGRLRKGESEALKDDWNPQIQKLFGSVAQEKDLQTRLIIRDAFLDEDILKQMNEKTGKFSKLELEYTEAKWENTIDRLTSAANPRQLERVPSGVEFNFSIIFNFYEDSDKELLKMLLEGMHLLEDDYLGGSGSRGYGQIFFKDISVLEKTSENYKNNEKAKELLNAKKLNEIDIDSIEI